MDIKGVKKELAGMLGAMLQIDPVTGLPYTTPPELVGKKVTAYPQAPMSIDLTALPCWMIFSGPASYPVPPDRSEHRFAYETRDFDLVLYVAVAQAGIDGEAERKVEPYVEAARALIQSHALMYDGLPEDTVSGIMQVYPIRDEGVRGDLRYGQNDPNTYVGLRFILRVEGRNLMTYGNE